MWLSTRLRPIKLSKWWTRRHVDTICNLLGKINEKTVYYYRCRRVGEEFSFKTAPVSLPVEFVIAGCIPSLLIPKFGPAQSGKEVSLGAAASLLRSWRTRIEGVRCDLGQTEWTKSTLAHISKLDYDMLLMPGDLSYADKDQPLWDSFGRTMQPSAST
ncbi:Purple acid [Carex littledalei]|uniref:Purple acid n=1 Tax=Carex littledalei TaxID=544730 RepID=A0A833Q9E2_9POAL|nr:Purple acid [Carex littledalei]